MRAFWGLGVAVAVVVVMAAPFGWAIFRQAQYVRSVEHAIVSTVADFGDVRRVRSDGFGDHGGNGKYCEAQVEVLGVLQTPSLARFRDALESRVPTVEGLFVDRQEGDMIQVRAWLFVGAGLDPRCW